MVLDDFPRGRKQYIDLPNGPITAITSVKYLDVGNVERTLLTGTDIYPDMDSIIGRIFPAHGKPWPDTSFFPNAVRIRYAAGWTRTNFPPSLKQWMLIRIAGLYQQRETHMVGLYVSPMDNNFCDSLLDSYTVMEGP
jgi:hypothetical protein